MRGLELSVMERRVSASASPSRTKSLLLPFLTFPLRVSVLSTMVSPSRMSKFI